MANQFLILITGRDKTGEAAAAVERKYSRLGKRLEGFGKLSKALTGQNLFQGVADRLGGIGKFAGEAKTGLDEAGLALGGFEGTALLATGIVGGLGLAVGAAAYKAVDFASKYNIAGAEIERTSRRIGDSSSDLQRWRLGAAYSGVSADAMTASLEGLGSTMQDAVAGRNQTALWAMNRFGIQLHRNKDGSVDTTRGMMDLARAIDTVDGAQRKAVLAQLFGVSPALPMLLRGSARVQKDLAAANASGAMRANTAESERFAQSLTSLHQHWLRLMNDVGQVLSPPATGIITFVDRSLQALDRLFSGWDKFESVMKHAGALTALMRGDIAGFIQLEEASRPKTPPAKPGAKPPPAVAGQTWELPDLHSAAKWVGKTFEDFAGRIEWQESRGRQFNRSGAPLVSPAGAIGAMQLEPGTARAAAQRLGVPFDANRLATDAGYNRQLGREELRFLLARYGGDKTLAAAAYNAGPGALEGHWNRARTGWIPGWLQRFGDPRKGEVSDQAFAARIPFAETRNYVQAFTGAGPAEVAQLRPPALPALPMPSVPGLPSLVAPDRRAYAALTPPATPVPLFAPTPASYVDDANPVRNPGAQAVKVEISLKGAPRGTLTRVSGSPNIDARVRVERAMDLETAA